MEWFFISPFSISVLNVAILLLFMIFFFAKTKGQSNVPKLLMAFFAGVNLVFLCFFFIFSSIVPSYTTIAWWIMHLVVFATIPMVQFAYYFKGNYYEKESKIALVITTLAAILSYPHYIYKTLHLTPIFNFEGFLFAFRDTPELGIIIGLELVWVVIVLIRKALLLSRENVDPESVKSVIKLSVIFLSPLILVVGIILAYANLLSWQVVAHILGTGIMIFVFIFIIVYINTSSEPSTFMIKLIGISLGSILIIFGFSSSITFYTQNVETNKKNLVQMEQCRTAVINNNFSEIPQDVRYIIARPGSEGQNSTNHRTIYSKDKNFDIGLINWANLDKDFKENIYSTWQYRKINPLDVRTYYIIYNFNIGDTTYEVGYNYLKYRKEIHETGELLVYLILLASVFVVIVFPYFFREGLLRPLEMLLKGVKQVNEGNLKTEVPVLVKDEIGILSESFNKMVSSINEAREELDSAFKHQIALTDAYSCFVPKEFLNFLEKESIINIKLGDHVQKKMSILFSDIRSFTKLSEKMNPQENFDFVNNYFTRVGPVIRKNNGFIDKYIGDSLMALFPERPGDALLAAIETQKEINNYNEQAMKEDLPPINIGIGIHTGELMLGTIGEEKRMEGTVISNAVNLAARMEKLTKLYNAGIVISADTLNSLGEPSRYNFRYLDRVQVKGKKEWVDVYECFDGDGARTVELKKKTKNDFEEAIKLYQKKEIEKALELFEKTLDENKNDKAAGLYVDRCRYFVKYGIPEDWEGITNLNTT